MARDLTADYRVQVMRRDWGGTKPSEVTHDDLAFRTRYLTVKNCCTSMLADVDPGFRGSYS